jgi:hypothetical protein
LGIERMVVAKWPESRRQVLQWQSNNGSGREDVGNSHETVSCPHAQLKLMLVKDSDGAILVSN